MENDEDSETPSEWSPDIEMDPLPIGTDRLALQGQNDSNGLHPFADQSLESRTRGLVEMAESTHEDPTGSVMPSILHRAHNSPPWFPPPQGQSSLKGKPVDSVRYFGSNQGNTALQDFGGLQCLELLPQPFMNQSVPPQIPALHQFAGPSVHPWNWQSQLGTSVPQTGAVSDGSSPGQTHTSSWHDVGAAQQVTHGNSPFNSARETFPTSSNDLNTRQCLGADLEPGTSRPSGVSSCEGFTYPDSRSDFEIIPSVFTPDTSQISGRETSTSFPNAGPRDFHPGEPSRTAYSWERPGPKSWGQGFDEIGRPTNPPSRSVLSRQLSFGNHWRNNGHFLTGAGPHINQGLDKVASPCHNMDDLECCSGFMLSTVLESQGFRASDVKAGLSPEKPGLESPPETEKLALDQTVLAHKDRSDNSAMVILSGTGEPESSRAEHEHSHSTSAIGHGGREQPPASAKSDLATVPSSSQKPARALLPRPTAFKPAPEQPPLVHHDGHRVFHSSRDELVEVTDVRTRHMTPDGRAHAKEIRKLGACPECKKRKRTVGVHSRQS